MSTHNSGSSRTHKRIRNNHLLEKLSYQGDVLTSTSIELIQYNDKELQTQQVGPTDNLKNLVKDNYVNWFKIIGISDVNDVYNICKSFGINSVDIKDMLSSKQITKAIVYENTTFILMSECTATDIQELTFNQVAFILGENYVISFQESTEPIFDDVAEAIKASRAQLRDRGADYLLYILLNDVHACYNDTIIKLTDHINEIEDSLIGNHDCDTNIMMLIRKHKREYSLLKRVVSSMREEFVNVLHNTNRLIRSSNIMYFNDYDDKLRTSLDDLEMFYLSISSLSDLYFNNNNLKMNNVIKKLTIVSTIFIPLTFIVGVWGMNFDIMPELRWRYGYLFAWGVMILIAVIAIFLLKRKKWF